MKKKIISMVALGLCLIFTGCGVGTSNSAVDGAKRDSITMAVSEDISDLNAHLYNGSMLAQDIVFETLIRNTEEGPQPALAESWDLSEDGRIYTFHLRKGIKFTDGEPFDAEAVKANIDAILDNKELHSWLELTSKIVSCDVVDKNTVNLVLAEAYYPTLAEIGLTRPYRMMSPKTFKNGGTKEGVSEIAGTGAYKLKEHVNEQYAIFVVNEEYWGGVPEIKTITMRVMPAGETPLLAMKKGEINFLFSTDTSGVVDADALRNLEKDDKFKVTVSKPMSTRYMLTNSSPERHISDKNIKHALWHAINREDLAKGVFSGFETPAQSIFAKSVPYANVELPPREYDVNKAKSLIEKSGWVFHENTGFYEKNGERLSLELIYNSSTAINKSAAEFIQASAKDAGIDISLVAVEGNMMRELRSQSKYDLYLDRSWGLPYDPQSTITALFSKSALSTVTEHLSNVETMHNIILKALSTTDEAKRKALFAEELKIIHEEACFIPLSYSSAIVVSEKDLKGVSFNQSQFEFPFVKLGY